MGLKGMIGKGLRSPAVLESIVKNSAVYFAAIGGEGALLAKKITGCSVIAFDDLRTEAVYKLTVKDFPVITAIDCHGKNAYETERAKYTLY
jgi:fumarate hydratase subunit beta